LPNSILEDSINKPWRPLPAKRLTPDEARHCLLLAVPSTLSILYLLGGFYEALWMVVLTWMYNDLGGADEGYVSRNLIQVIAFILHARGSTIVAARKAYSLGPHAGIWFALIGAIVFTSIQMQDLEDMEGDAERERKTLPLVHGEQVGRLSVAIPVAVWSFACPDFWGLGPFGYLPSALVGGTAAVRVLACRTLNSDRMTWKLWCFLIICIYLLPLLKENSVFGRFCGGLKWIGVWI
jgi:4-hydroxybenzoate polyprenyltransferase